MEDNLDLPINGKMVIVTENDGSKTHAYRCACENPKCTEWRDVISGSAILLDVKEWEYSNDDVPNLYMGSFLDLI